MSEEKIVGILKDISQLIVAVLVSEDDTSITVKDAALLGVTANEPNGGGQINISFIPVDLLTLTPVFGVRNLLKNPTQEFTYVFNKSTLLKYGFELADNVIDNYKRAFNKISNVVIPGNNRISPEENIVKLF